MKGDPCKFCSRPMTLADGLTCNRCKRRQRREQGLCRDCNTLTFGETFCSKHRERQAAYVRKWKAKVGYTNQAGILNAREQHLKRHYGISAARYVEILDRQKGKCAICGSIQQGRQLDVDHDHITGEVRGILCSQCNRALGLFQDDLINLLSAANYLLVSQGRPTLFNRPTRNRIALEWEDQIAHDPSLRMAIDFVRGKLGGFGWEQSDSDIASESLN